MVRNLIRALAYSAPLSGRLLKQRDAARQQLRDFQKSIGWQHGEFYSPIPPPDEHLKRDDPQRRKHDHAPPGINLNMVLQPEILNHVIHYYPELPFAESENNKHRYHLDNDYFVYADGIFLYGLMRHFRPKRIVEVGSGYSSAAMLDTNQLFFDNAIQLTFIEPYPENRLSKLLREQDQQYATVYAQKLQELTDTPWDQLQANDFLFIDSSHVSKCGSDVNQLFFEILPELAPGVIVHIHDVFTGFEYPADWLRGGIFWNEAYLLRAFLMFNTDFEILVWPSFLLSQTPEAAAAMPLCMKNTGSSIWIRRRANR